MITSNTDLATLLGNLFLPATVRGRAKESVGNVAAGITHNEADRSERVGAPPLALLREIDLALLREIDRGLRHVLDL